MNRFSFLAACFVCCIMISSCGKDDSTVSILPKDYVGTWSGVNTESLGFEVGLSTTLTETAFENIFRVDTLGFVDIPFFAFKGALSQIDEKLIFTTTHLNSGIIINDPNNINWKSKSEFVDWDTKLADYKISEVDTLIYSVSGNEISLTDTKGETVTLEKEN